MPESIILDDPEHALLDVLKGSSLDPGGTLARSELLASVSGRGFEEERLVAALETLGEKEIVKALDGDRVQVTATGRELIRARVADSGGA